MKNFVKENWYKLMIGSSMMMASFGFMIYAISPAYSNSERESAEIKNKMITYAPVGANGVVLGSDVFFVDGGYIYRNYAMKEFPANYWNYDGAWSKYKLP